MSSQSQNVQSPHTGNNKQKKVKKFQNKLIMNSCQPALQAMSLSSLFLYTKKVTKQFASFSEDSQMVDLSELLEWKSQIQDIFQFLVDRISQTKLVQAGQFVAMLSIFVYGIVNVNGANRPKFGGFDIQISERFYLNINRNIAKIAVQWNEQTIGAHSRQAQQNISILLCSLSELVGQVNANICQITYSKMFTWSTIGVILSLKLPNSQKQLKSLKKLVSYIHKQPSSLNQKRQVTQTLFHILHRYTSSKSLQLMCMYLLNQDMEDEKLMKKVGSTWTKTQLEDVLRVCIEFLGGKDHLKPSQVGFVGQFSQKIVSMLGDLHKDLLDADGFLRLFDNLSKVFLATERLSLCLEKMLSRMQQEQQQKVTGTLLRNTPSTFNIIQLQLLQISTKNMQEPSIINLIRQGSYQKLIYPSPPLPIPKQQGAGTPTTRESMHYRKYLLGRIVGNLVKNCGEGSGVGVILDNLYHIVRA